MESYDLPTDAYLLTCGDQHQVVTGNAMNDWTERDDGLWDAP